MLKELRRALNEYYKDRWINHGNEKAMFIQQGGDILEDFITWLTSREERK